MKYRVKKFLLCCPGLVIPLLLLPLAAFAEDVPLRGFIDSFGYGYTVTVSINGTGLKVIRGGGQQATRIFSANHPLRAQSQPDRSDLFVLREGENSIAVTFQKKGGPSSPLEIKLEIPDRYAIPLFRLKSSKTRSGQVERKFIIEKKMPPAFTTMLVTDDNL
jgi:hypothetical protein